MTKKFFDVSNFGKILSKIKNFQRFLCQKFKDVLNYSMYSSPMSSVFDLNILISFSLSTSDLLEVLLQVIELDISPKGARKSSIFRQNHQH